MPSQIIRKKKVLLWAGVLLSAVLLLCGCRVRTTAVLPSGDPAFPRTEEGGGEAGTDGYGPAMGLSETGSDTDPSDGSSDEPAADGRTKEDPDALRREYDENAAAEIVPDKPRLIHGQGEGTGASEDSDDPAPKVSKLNDRADRTASRTVPVDEADNTGVSEDAEQAETSLQYFTVLLQERTRSLYECKRSYVYWETVQDHVTIFKTSAEHQMILDAGAYDVSARLLEENLRVDDGWVVRKNPGVIVKVVPAEVLGAAVRSDLAAKQASAELAARHGWKDIDAVRQGRVLLLSEELLTEPYLRLGAMLAVAKTAAPDQFADVDPAEALKMLITEAAGETPEGKYFYTGGE